MNERGRPFLYFLVSFYRLLYLPGNDVFDLTIIIKEVKAAKELTKRKEIRKEKKKKIAFAKNFFSFFFHFEHSMHVLTSKKKKKNSKCTDGVPQAIDFYLPLFIF